MRRPFQDAVERAGLDQPLEKGAPAVKEVLKVVHPGLIESVLDRALVDDLVRSTIREIGYVDPTIGFAADTCRSEGIRRGFGARRL